jgi:hypothetical protein
MCAMSPRLLRPVASGFDPRRIAGLEAWWDGSDSASVTLDSGRVAEWRDKSGKARHAANSTSGSTQPDYITAGQNGRNLLRFTAGSNQRLVVPSNTAFSFLHDGTPSYVAVVASFGTTANPAAIYGVFGNINGGSFQRGFVFFYEDRSGTNDRLLVLVQNAAGSEAAVSTQNASYDGLLPTQQKMVVEMVIDSANPTAAQRFSARRNGGTAVAANAQTNAPSSGAANSDLFIGSAASNNSLSVPLQGDICELLMYSQHPTSAAQTALRKYLAAKWGVTLS